ncbi:MAG: response regulator [Acidobacteria bacterium]|nr:response regulator [Acidobacteriota bacterium]
MSTILVVENDPMSRELCRRVLATGGHDIVCARSAEEALRLVGRARPDLVLMDIRLPGMDGIEAARRLRTRRFSPPVAVLSAQAFSTDAQRAREAGCVDFLIKPLGARELLERVEGLLARHPGPPRSLNRRGGKKP